MQTRCALGLFPRGRRAPDNLPAGKGGSTLPWEKTRLTSTGDSQEEEKDGKRRSYCDWVRPFSGSGT